MLQLKLQHTLQTQTEETGRDGVTDLMHYNFQSVYYTGNDLKNNFSQVAAPSEFEVCKGLYSMILYLVIVNDQYTAC